MKTEKEGAYSQWREYILGEEELLPSKMEAEGFHGILWQDAPLWEYDRKVEDFLRSGTRLLDISPGGGEHLLSLRHPYELISAGRSSLSEYELCKKGLSPYGIEVRRYEDHAQMPFGDESFDLVINRHGRFDILQIKRLLKKGGFFITEQIGGESGICSSWWIMSGKKRPGPPDFNLENQVPVFRANGFKVMYRNQCYRKGRILHAPKTCRSGKDGPVASLELGAGDCAEQLSKLEQEIDKRGYAEIQSHKFIIIAKKAS